MRAVGQLAFLNLAFLAASVFCGAFAAEVKVSTIEFKGKSYHYQFAVDVAAPVDAVRSVVTDYDNLKRINNDVVESEVLERYDDHRLKRRMWINHCLLVFCFDLIFVEDVETLSNGAIRTTVIPRESNFSDGESLWHVEAIDATTTRVSVEAHQTPNFWIPPVIGPLVFKRAFVKEVRETGRKIEREANRVGSE